MHAVLFDLYETLVRELSVPVRRASSLATQLGVDEAAYKREWKSRRPEILLGHCTFQEALAQIRDKLGSRVDHAVLEQLRAERVAEKTAVLAKVEPEVFAAIAELRRRGVKLALVTNCLPEDVEGWGGSRSVRRRSRGSTSTLVRLLEMAQYDDPRRRNRALARRRGAGSRLAGGAAQMIDDPAARLVQTSSR